MCARAFGDRLCWSVSALLACDETTQKQCLLMPVSALVAVSVDLKSGLPTARLLVCPRSPFWESLSLYFLFCMKIRIFHFHQEENSVRQMDGHFHRPSVNADDGKLDTVAGENAHEPLSVLFLPPLIRNSFFAKTTYRPLLVALACPSRCTFTSKV